MIRQLNKLKLFLLFFFKRKDSIKYYGYLGYNNLGDEALYSAINNLFRNFVVFKPKISNKWLSNLLDKKKFDIAMLGGGTLICAELKGKGNKKVGLPFIHEFENAIKNVDEFIVFGTGVDENENGLLVDNWLIEWKEILTKAKYVSCRGPRSKRILGNIGIDAEVIGDPAMSLIKEKDFWAPEPKTIGVNVRPYKYNVKVEAEYLGQMAVFLQKLIQQGWQVEFVAVSPMDIEPINVIIDKLTGYEPILHASYSNHESFFEIARRFKVFFGVRLHAVMLAMCAGVPSTMLSYRKKCHDFSESISMVNLNIDIDNITHSRLDDLLEFMTENGQVISEEIYERFTEYKALQDLRAQELVHGP